MSVPLSADPSISTPAPPTRSWRARLDEVVAPYLYIAPFFLLFGLFGLFPILYTAFVSLHEWDIIGDHSWTGLANYADLFADGRFWLSVRNTLSIWVLSTVPQLAVAIGLAHLLNEHRLRGARVTRFALLVPNVTSVVAVGIVFESIFGLRYGIINAGLDALGMAPINWQAGVLSSHVAIATMVMWRWTGYNTIIYLAGLQAIPSDLYDAARVDGATRWQQFRHVTIPMLRPVIVFTVIVSTIGGLQIFAEPLIFGPPSNYTGGSARQFQTLTLFMYEQAFRRFKFGYGSAIAWVLFLLIAVFVVANWWLSRRVRSSR